MNGQIDVYARLVRRFAELHAGDIERIRERVSHEDAEGAALVAHTLKGAAGNLGAAGVSSAADRILAAIRRRDDQDGLQRALAAAQALLAPMAASIVAWFAPDAAANGVGAVLDAAEVEKALDDLETALAASDIQANAIIGAGATVFRAALGNAYEHLSRQIADYLFSQALETLRRARGHAGRN